MDQPLQTSPGAHPRDADPHGEIREEVRKLCARFPGIY